MNSYGEQVRIEDPCDDSKIANLFRKGNLPLAEMLLRTSLEKDPTNPKTLYYLGLIASAVNLWSGLHGEDRGPFAAWGELRQVMSVVVPTAIYVGSMPYTGLYVGSIVFIGWFMRRLGKYSWPVVLALALGMPVITYIVFERWFLVPLPKGPIEEWLDL